MTDLEFEILDELYFVISFEALCKNLQMDESVLKDGLLAVYNKGWLRIFDKESDEDINSLDYFHKNYKKYNYLASKEGLLAHNSR